MDATSNRRFKGLFASAKRGTKPHGTDLNQRETHDGEKGVGACPVDVFVFGTLKRRRSLHQCVLHGACRLGKYRTRQAFPLVIAGPWFAPMMFNEPGHGRNVLGEVYRIDAARLETIHRLESIGRPGNFRNAIEVVPLTVGLTLKAFAYMKSREMTFGIYHSHFLETYDDDRFVVPWQR